VAVVDGEARWALSQISDAEIQRSLDGLIPAGAVVTSTLTHRPGDRGRYSLNSLHAGGGIGQVWLVHDAELNREVALKELRPEHISNTTALNRFLDEARIIGQLEHPGVVPVYELVRQSPDHSPFYTMRFIRGRTLAESARSYHRKRRAGHSDPLDLLTLLNAFVAVCNTVAYARSRGVVHRDLKGQNIILGDFGDVVVLDWGLAKVLGGSLGTSDPLVNPRINPVADKERTVQGQVIGTPGYMAPEQAMGRPDLVDFRTDVYGLGAILYEILVGRPPFEGHDPFDVLRRVREEEPVPPCQLNGEVPLALESAAIRALAKDPSLCTSPRSRVRSGIARHIHYIDY
jgi:serine/threonine protein kinase